MSEALSEALEKPLIVYGWGPDDLIASIILLTNTDYTEAGLSPCNSWRPTHQRLESIAVISREYKSVILAGTRWTGVEIDLLAPMVLAPIVAIDNNWSHLLPRRPNVTYINPSPRGDPRGLWPSVASIISSLVSNKLPHLAAAGVVSRLWMVAPSNRIYQNLASMAGLNHKRDYGIIEDCAWQAYGVTSNGDPKVYGRVPQSIVEASPNDPCKGLLGDSLLAVLRAEAEESLSEALDNIEESQEREAVVYYSSGDGRHYYTISFLLALKTPEKLVVVGYRDKRFKDNYACAWSIRGEKPLSRRLIEARSRGLEAVGVYQGLLNYLCIRSRDGRVSLDKLVDKLLSIVSYSSHSS